MAVLDTLFTQFRDKALVTIEGEFPDGATFEIEVDAVVMRQPRYRAQVAASPVEDGSEITDNRVIEADEISVELFVSDHPVRYLAGAFHEGGGGLSALTGNVEPRSKIVAKQLLDAHRGHALLRVPTRFEVFEDMSITSMDMPQSRATGHALQVNLELRKVNRVQLLAVTVPKGLLDVAKKQVAKGKQSNKSASSGAAAKKAKEQSDSTAALLKALGV